MRDFFFSLFHPFTAPAGARYLRPFLRRSFSTLRPEAVWRRARKPEVRARARRVPWRVQPRDLPPAVTTNAPRPTAGLRVAIAEGMATPERSG